MRDKLQLVVVLTIALGASLATPSCKSQRHTPPAYDPAGVTCICGEPEAAFDGCHHPLCIRGEGNPENPHCVCGSIFDDEEGN